MSTIQSALECDYTPCFLSLGGAKPQTCVPTLLIFLPLSQHNLLEVFIDEANVRPFF